MKNGLYLVACALLITNVVACSTLVYAAPERIQDMNHANNIPTTRTMQSSGDSWLMQASGFEGSHRGIGYVSAVDANVAWASGGGYTRTTNGGETWVPNTIPGTEDLTYSMIYALSEDTAWACLFSYFINPTGTQGIYATTDGGATWDRQTTAEFNLLNGSFPNCVHFWDENIGWCMGDPVDGYYEMYTTVDGGTIWTRVPQENIPAPAVNEVGTVGYYDVIGDTIWYGTTAGRVYKSIDKGHHWTVAQTPLEGFIKPCFRDENNGVVIEQMYEARLAETADGGATWRLINFTGNCYHNDLCYVPGTDNMYVSSGFQEGASGASCSHDGCHSWTEYDAQMGLQMTKMDFKSRKIGWAGGFTINQTTGGMWKYVPSLLPEFTISIAGGKGLTVTVKNVGITNATNVSVEITIENSLFITPKTFLGMKETLADDQEFIVPGTPRGIGLGIFLPMPKINVHVTCDENVTEDKTVDAKILFTSVRLV